MNVDLSRQEIALIIRRFNGVEQRDIDEQVLVKKLSEYLPPAEPTNIMAKYQQHFKQEVPLPPPPK